MALIPHLKSEMWGTGHPALIPHLKSEMWGTRPVTMALIPRLKGEMWGTRHRHIAAKGTLSQYMRLILRPGHP